jgi:membrane-associated phospholipid phosphatase
MSDCKVKIYPYDFLILGYVTLVSILIIIFGRPLGLYYDELLMNAGFAAIVILAINYLKNTDHRVIAFFRFMYPAVLFTFFYEQTGGLMRLFFPSFLDYRLVELETAIFGIEPTLWLDKNLINVFLTEILSFSYFSYYFMLIAVLIPLYIARRYREIRQLLTASSLVFFVSFLLFFLYPVEGPRYYLADQYSREIVGPIFRRLVNLVIKGGAVHGGCMPSSHVGVGLTVMFFALKYLRPLGLTLIPINIGLAIGAVYGRFHYFSDIVVGAAIGATITHLTFKYYRLFEPAGEYEKKEEEKAVKIVS